MRASPVAGLALLAAGCIDPAPLPALEVEATPADWHVAVEAPDEFPLTIQVVNTGPVEVSLRGVDLVAEGLGVPIEVAPYGAESLAIGQRLDLIAWVVPEGWDPEHGPTRSGDIAVVVGARSPSGVSVDAADVVHVAVTCDTDGDGTWAVACGGSDCDDRDEATHIGAEEDCSPQDRDCDGAPQPSTDQDGDGFALCQDCDDLAPGTYPGAPEACDGRDNDCNGLADADAGFESDEDADGFRSCVDCDDTRATVFPGAPEGCDGLDSDCVGGPDTGPGREVDEDGDGSLACADCDDDDPELWPGNPELCDGIDSDCDGLADADPLLERDLDGDGFLSCEDCDESDPASHPGAPELCDGQDNDCNGLADHDPAHEVDADGDGSRSCEDCDDGDATHHPGAFDDCDGLDQDCDGLVDGGWTHVPADHAGIQDAIDSGASSVCVAPGLYVGLIDPGVQEVWIQSSGGSAVTHLQANTSFWPMVALDGGLSEASGLVGFTLVGTFQYSQPDRAGLRILGGAPQLRDLVLTGFRNSAGPAASYVVGSAARFVDVHFLDNNSTVLGGGALVRGGAVTFEDCTFVDNMGGLDGGALWLGPHPETGVAHDTTLLNVVFDSNAGSTPGVYVGGGTLTGSHVRISDGFGIHAGAIDAQFGALVDLSHVAILGNYASEDGAFTIGGSTVHLSQCVIHGNDGGDERSVASVVAGTLTLDGCIVSDNLSDDGVLLSLAGSQFTATDSVFWGLAPEAWTDAFDPIGLDGNQEAAPGFLDVSEADPALWDLHLPAASPLVDAGPADAADPDGSPADPGVYGGPAAGGWDLDGDGDPEWWHPGPYDPALDPASGWDCDDRDPSVGPLSGC